MVCVCLQYFLQSWFQCKLWGVFERLVFCCWMPKQEFTPLNLCCRMRCRWTIIDTKAVHQEPKEPTFQHEKHSKKHRLDQLVLPVAAFKSCMFFFYSIYIFIYKSITVLAFVFHAWSLKRLIFLRNACACLLVVCIWYFEDLPQPEYYQGCQLDNLSVIETRWSWGVFELEEHPYCMEQVEWGLCT